MKKFRFHLQAVLDVREERLKQAQLAFAVEEQKRVAIVNDINDVQKGIKQSFEDYNALMDQGQIVVTQSEQFSAYIQRQRGQIANLNYKLQAQEKSMASARQALQWAKAQHRSFELLKEKHWKQFLKQIDKQEEETLSEIALNQYRKGLSSAR